MLTLLFCGIWLDSQVQKTKQTFFEYYASFYLHNHLGYFCEHVLKREDSALSLFPVTEMQKTQSQIKLIHCWMIFFSFSPVLTVMITKGKSLFPRYTAAKGRHSVGYPSQCFCTSMKNKPSSSFPSHRVAANPTFASFQSKKQKL